MRKFPLSVWIHVTTLVCLSAGCSAPPFLRTNGWGQPAVGSQPGPIKQFTATVGATRVGQSISKVFKPSSTTNDMDPSDPVSLASKTKPATAEFYVNLGKVKEDSNNVEGAREAYHKALSMRPHHLGALAGLGRVFEKQGQFARAAQHYLEATRYHPNDAGAFNDLGMCYARQHRYADAVAALKRATELKPDRALYRNNIAMVLVKLNRIDEALTHLTDAHGEAAAHYNIGYLLYQEHREQMALEHFHLAVQRDPSFEKAQQAIEMVASTPPADEQLAVGVSDSATTDESLVVDSRPQPSAAGQLDQPEREPLPGAKSWSPRGAVPADAADVETITFNDDGDSVVSGDPEPNGDHGVVRENEPALEARLRPLPPVDRKYRTPSRY